MKRLTILMFVLLLCSASLQHHVDYNPDYQSPTELISIDKIEYKNGEMLIHFRQIFAQNTKAKLKYKFVLATIDNKLLGSPNGLLSPYLNRPLNDNDLVNESNLKKGEVYTCVLAYSMPPDSVKTVHLLRDKDKYVFKNIKIKNAKDRNLGTAHSSKQRIHLLEKVAQGLRKEAIHEGKEQKRLEIAAITDDSQDTPTEDFKQFWLNRVNNLRKEVGKGKLPMLIWDDSLYKAAYLHAKDMEKQGYVSHESLDGRTLEIRVKQAGYPGWATGENIVGSLDHSSETAYNGWLNSPGHYRNMIGKYHMCIGVASYKKSFVMVLGGVF